MKSGIVSYISLVIPMSSCFFQKVCEFQSKYAVQITTACIFVVYHDPDKYYSCIRAYTLPHIFPHGLVNSNETMCEVLDLVLFDFYFSFSIFSREYHAHIVVRFYRKSSKKKYFNQLYVFLLIVRIPETATN